MRNLPTKSVDPGIFQTAHVLMDVSKRRDVYMIDVHQHQSIRIIIYILH